MALRGGSWNNNANNIRAANRNNNAPANRNNNLGFRCAQQSLPPNRVARCAGRHITRSVGEFSERRVIRAKWEKVLQPVSLVRGNPCRR